MNKEWHRPILLDYESRKQDSKIEFPLIKDTISNEEIIASIDVLLSGQLTMNTNVFEFEKEFAKKVGVKYAIMCNSGSSANLLALACITNKLRSKHLDINDEILIPAVCWSTSLSPIIQLGLKPIFVDVNPDTMNIDINDLKKKITKSTKGLLLVHVLGNTCDMNEVIKLVNNHNLILIEDTCESLGSLYNDKYLGTFGDFSTYSFYYSHHITTGEGGMIICKTLEDYNLLKCLRAHGWTRDLSNKEEINKKYPKINDKFLFINFGYNLRPIEISAAIGRCQLKKLDMMNYNRKLNRINIINSLKTHDKWNNQLIFTSNPKNSDPAWFGFTTLLSEQFKHQYFDYLQYLSDNGIENRPIISGNITRQPIINLLDQDINPKDFLGAEIITERGFFLGIHTTLLSDKKIKLLTDKLLNFNFKSINIKTILVTGGSGLVGQGIKNYIKNIKSDNYIFLSSKDGDLRNYNDTKIIFEKYKPTHVIHLAVKLMSGNMMNNYPVDMLEDNTLININVLKCAHKYNVKKLVSLLSPFAYPEHVKIPIMEYDLHNGPCYLNYESYGTAKRQLELLSRYYRKQYNCNFITVIPTNIFGPKDQYRLNGPVVEALIAKCIKASTTNTDIVCYGSGQVYRQFCYSKDLSKTLLWILDNYNDDNPINITGHEISIKELAITIAKKFNVQNKLIFDTSYPDGPVYRTLCDDKLVDIYKDYQKTDLKQSINEVINTIKLTK